MIDNVLLLQADEQLRLIEAISTPHMKKGDRSKMISAYLKVVNPNQKSGTIKDRERLKRILGKK